MGGGTVFDERKLQHGVVEVLDIAVPSCRARILAQCSHAGITVVGEEHAANSGATPDNSTKARTAATILRRTLTLTPRVG
jgi:hypothetical protein